MMIKVSCQCGKIYSVKDGLAGKVVRCKDCGEKLRIAPSGNEPEMLSENLCLGCGIEIHLGETYCQACEQHTDNQLPVAPRRRSVKRKKKRSSQKKKSSTTLDDAIKEFSTKLKSPGGLISLLLEPRWATYVFHFMMWIVAPGAFVLSMLGTPGGPSGPAAWAGLSMFCSVCMIALTVIYTVLFFIVHWLRESPFLAIPFALFILVPLLPISIFWFLYLILIGGFGFLIGSAIDDAIGSRE